MTRKEFLFILIVTFVVVMIWITANILHSQSRVSTSEQLQQVLEDVNPNFDKALLDKVNKLP